MNKKSDLICPECEKIGAKYKIFLSIPEQCKEFDKATTYYIDEDKNIKEFDIDVLYSQKAICSNGHSLTFYLNDIVTEYELEEPITLMNCITRENAKEIYEEHRVLLINGGVKDEWYLKSIKKINISELPKEARNMKMKKFLFKKELFNKDFPEELKDKNYISEPYCYENGAYSIHMIYLNEKRYIL